jgi:hypothetical protein
MQNLQNIPGIKCSNFLWYNISLAALSEKSTIVEYMSASREDEES